MISLAHELFMSEYYTLDMSVEAAASAAAKQLGYGALKYLQLESIEGIATGRDVFGCQLAIYVMVFALSLTFASSDKTFH